MDLKQLGKMYGSPERKCEIEKEEKGEREEKAKKEKSKSTGNNKKRVPYVGAPYNFVSFPDKVFEYVREDDKGLPSHSKLDLGKENYTGEISYLIKAATPIFVGGEKMRSGEEEKQEFYKNHEGKYAIPGNSVRGLVRSNVQVLSCSSMADDIEDYSIMYRAVAGGHNSERYKEILDTPDKALGNVKAGYLRREKDGYYIYSTISDGQYFTLSERTLITKYLELKDKSEWTFSRLLSENHNELQHEAEEFIEETKKQNGDTVITYKGTRNPNFIPHSSRISYTVEGEEIVGIEEEDISGEEEETKKQGYVHFSGPMGEKKAFYVIPQIDNDPQKAIKLAEKDVKSFQVDFATKENQLKGLVREKQRKEKMVEFFNLPKEGEEKPVFYVEEGGRIYFGYTPYLRVFYDHNIYAGFPEGYRTDKIDYAKALFGYSKEQKAYRSRLYFTDAVLKEKENEKCESLKENGKTPQYILSSPKPSSYKDYLKPRKGMGSGVVSYNGKFELRGLKQYWLHKCIEKSKVTDEKKGAKIPALEITSERFEGKIRYKNLSAEELGLILWALKLRETSWQNIGQGKPYGFGRIRIEIQKVNRFDCKKAYGLDKLDWWDPMNNITGKTEALIQKYKDMIKKQYGVNIEAQKHVKEFFMMKENMPPVDKIEYMSVAEKDYHTNREVLPEVEVVAGYGKNKK